MSGAYKCGRVMTLVFASACGGCAVMPPTPVRQDRSPSVPQVPTQERRVELSRHSQEFYEALVKAFQYTQAENSYLQESKRRAQISVGMLQSVRQRNQMAGEACSIVNRPELRKEMDSLGAGYRRLLGFMLADKFIKLEEARPKLEIFEQQVAYAITNFAATAKECRSLRR